MRRTLAGSPIMSMQEDARQPGGLKPGVHSPGVHSSLDSALGARAGTGFVLFVFFITHTPRVE